MPRCSIGLDTSEEVLLADTSRPNISAYEHGHRSPTLETLESLLAANGQHLVAGALVDGNLLIDIWAEAHLPDSIRAAWQPLIE